MLIPKYWKHITKTVDGIDMSNCKRHWSKGNKAYISSWGYSNESEIDALSKAHERLAETVEALKNPQDEGFYYPHSVIKEDIEQVIDVQNGEAIISRNRYGALVLNTDKLMFIDIDIPVMIKGEPNFLQKLFGKKYVWKDSSSRDKQLFIENKIDEINQFTDANPEVGFKVYRTFAGLRVIATHKIYSVDSDETHQIFDALGADPLYQKLCRLQGCFRARLTPKRWRMNEADVKNKPKLTFRVTRNMLEEWTRSDDVRLAQYEQWTEVYDKATNKYASCHFIQQYGCTDIADELSDLIELHDSHCNANSGKSLA
jgi:hypothetical protein